jgi:hypothetical protein
MTPASCRVISDENRDGSVVYGAAIQGGPFTLPLQMYTPPFHNVMSWTYLTCNRHTKW